MRPDVRNATDKPQSRGSLNEAFAVARAVMHRWRGALTHTHFYCSPLISSPLQPVRAGLGVSPPGKIWKILHSIWRILAHLVAVISLILLHCGTESLDSAFGSIKFNELFAKYNWRSQMFWLGFSLALICMMFSRYECVRCTAAWGNEKYISIMVSNRYG